MDSMNSFQETAGALEFSQVSRRRLKEREGERVVKDDQTKLAQDTDR
jgi:hypothetical protein